MLEELPQGIRLDHAPGVLMCVSSDLDESGYMEPRWIVLDADSVSCYASDGRCTERVGRQQLQGAKKVMKRIIAYAKPYRRQMAAAGVALIAATLVDLAPPYNIKLIVNTVLKPSSFAGALVWLVLSLFAASLVRMVLQTVRGYLAVGIGSKMMGDIRRDVYRSLMRQSMAYFDRRQTTQFISRVNGDADAMRQFLTDGIIYLAGQVLTVVAIFIVMLRLNVLLALLAFLTTPVVLISSTLIWPFMRNLWYGQWRAVVRINSLVGDSLQGIRVVKAFGQEAAEVERFGLANSDLVGQTVRMNGYWQGVFPAFPFLTGIGGLLVWYYGGQSVLHDRMSIGTLIAFNAYLAMFLGPLQWFSQLSNWISNALATADRVFEIIDARPDVPEADRPAPLPRIDGRVTLRGVTFGYEAHRPVLQDVDLDVAAGEMIGFVGHSGAGKSTMINLICRFYDPDRGSVEVDGINLRGVPQEDLHRQIGVVLQETFLFDGTVAENIAYAKPDASSWEIIQAARIANAHDFILNMPDGYDTRVGERGHRLSTLRNADRLVVLQKGRIVESGSHEDLLRSEGVYHGLVQAQRELSRIKGVDG